VITENQYHDLQALLASGGWAILRDYINRRLARVQMDLERKPFDDLAEVGFLQGQIQALRSVLEFPGTRIREFDQKCKER